MLEAISHADGMKRPRSAVPPKTQRITFLRAWREHRELSQDQLGAKAGYTQGMISHWETGATDYTGNNLVNLARALECEPRDLLYRHPDTDIELADIVETMTIADRSRLLEIAKTMKRTDGS